MPLQAPTEPRMWPCGHCSCEWSSKLAAAECCRDHDDQED